MKRFDYIIAGGGCAGLSLAYHLSKSVLHQKSILIVDRDMKRQNDRTWCFWTKQPTLFDHLVYRSWNKIGFKSDDFEDRISLNEYSYKMIRGIDFYSHVRRKLSELGNVHWKNGNITLCEDLEKGAAVVVNGQRFEGKWLFNSLYNPTEMNRQPERYHYLMQHFKGWEIETEEDVFETDHATMFDFRTPQQGEMRFVYVLPYSPKKALVEYTLFSGDLLSNEEYEEGLRNYIKNVLKLDKYRISFEENGVIPMTDHPFRRRGGKHIMYIGTKGGITKPSTGYTFMRIQNDSKCIVDSLIKTGQPFYREKDAVRYRIYDSMLLQIMHRHGEKSKEIFTELFKNNPIERLFRFLDEETSLQEDLRIMSSVPAWPFIKSFIKVKALQKV